MKPVVLLFILIKIFFSVFPGPQVTTAVIEPYNLDLYTHTTHGGWAFIEDDQVIYNMCRLISVIQPKTYTYLQISQLHTFLQFFCSQIVDLILGPS